MIKALEHERTDTALLQIRDFSVDFIQYERGLRRRRLTPLREINMDVREGELLAVVGASGSGKSLLAHGILGILPYNATAGGQLIYRGKPLTAQRQQELRGKEIALVPQGVSWLDPLMKVGEQVKNGRRNPERQRDCRRALSRYGLGEEVEQLYPFQLSGGMARRVLLATAAIEQPRLIIADEPTPGLPNHTARRVLGHLQQMAEEGAAVLLITHDLSLAIEMADRIAVMLDGTIVDQVEAIDFQKGDRLQHPYSRALFLAMPEHDFQYIGEGGEG